MNRHPLMHMTLALTLTIAALPAIAEVDGHAGHGSQKALAEENAQNQIYSTTGVIEAIDAKAGKLTIKHEAIPALGWPGMTMRFAVEEPSLLHGLKTGETVRFDFRDSNGVYIVTDIEML